MQLYFSLSLSLASEFPLYRHEYESAEFSRYVSALELAEKPANTKLWLLFFGFNLVVVEEKFAYIMTLT